MECANVCLNLCYETDNVELLVDVENRLILPKFTAYILLAVLPLSCLIVPLIINSKYHSYGLEKEQVEEIEIVAVTYLVSSGGQIQRIDGMRQTSVNMSWWGSQMEPLTFDPQLKFGCLTGAAP